MSKAFPRRFSDIPFGTDLLPVASDEVWKPKVAEYQPVSANLSGNTLSIAPRSQDSQQSMASNKSSTQSDFDRMAVRRHSSQVNVGLK